MTTTAHRTTTQTPDTPTETADDAQVFQTTSSAPAVLDVLDSEHTRDILRVLREGPRLGRELIATCEASRSTVYRRLDRLEAAGIVTTESYLDPDGHHCESYRLQRDRLTVRIDSDAVTVTLQADPE